MSDIHEVRDMIQRDVIDVAKYHSEVGGGHYSIPRQVFCIVDFLGGVAYNNHKGERELTSTRKAVRFINEFFPVHYRPYSNLIVAMWRHGTVHGFRPVSYYTRFGNKKTVIKWSSNNSDKSHNLAVNLRFLDTETSGTVQMAVNIYQLATDLLDAVDKLIERMKRSPAFGRGCVKRMDRLLAPVNCMASKPYKKTRKNKKSTKKVVHSNIIRNQILKATKSNPGIVREGQQVTWYDNAK